MKLLGAMDDDMETEDKTMKMSIWPIFTWEKDQLKVSMSLTTKVEQNGTVSDATDGGILTIPKYWDESKYEFTYTSKKR